LTFHIHFHASQWTEGPCSGGVLHRRAQAPSCQLQHRPSMFVSGPRPPPRTAGRCAPSPVPPASEAKKLVLDAATVVFVQLQLHATCFSRRRTSARLRLPICRSKCQQPGTKFTVEKHRASAVAADTWFLIAGSIVDGYAVWLQSRAMMYS